MKRHVRGPRLLALPFVLTLLLLTAVTFQPLVLAAPPAGEASGQTPGSLGIIGKDGKIQGDCPLNAVFALLYLFGDQPIANVKTRDYIDYFYFSIETLSTAGYGDMHPQTHYGHFIATIELFTGIFSMSLMTGLIFARFSRPSARLLFANNPVIAQHEGKPTLMVRFANERHNIIGNATARLWLFKDIVTAEGREIRRFYELPLFRNESPALALSWTLYHGIDEQSPLYGFSAEDLAASDVSLIVVVSGYDVIAAQTVHARKSYQHHEILHGRRAGLGDRALTARLA